MNQSSRWLPVLGILISINNLPLVAAPAAHHGNVVGKHTAMRRITATVVAGLSVVTAVWVSAATARADVKCDGNAGANPAAREFYQEQYDPSVAKPLTKDLAAYHSAVASGDPKDVGDAAGTLYSKISSDVDMFVTQKLFGCYSPAVLASLQQATNTLASSYDSIDGAAANLGGKTPADVPGLVSHAKPQEKAYIDALNAYASQFGGQRVPQS
jgi:hypothetical protein